MMTTIALVNDADRSAHATMICTFVVIVSVIVALIAGAKVFAPTA